MSLGRQQCAAQRLRVAHGRRWIAGAHGQTRLHEPDIDGGARSHVTGARELGNQRRRQHDKIGRRAGEELLAHRSHTAEGAGDHAARGDLELVTQLAHEPLRSATAE